MIELRLVTSDFSKKLVKDIIVNHHSYVPTNASVGRRIDWLIYNVSDKDSFPVNEELIGMIGLGSSVYPPPKDILTHVKMTKNEYKTEFNSFANNWRFCVIKHIKNAGTQILKQFRNNAKVEWKNKYGDELKYIVTFVAGGKSGSVYKADNWSMIGETAGLPKHKSSSMKWDSSESLKEKFVKPTGENKKMIFIKSVI
jgi:hypothetical protein